MDCAGRRPGLSDLPSHGFLVLLPRRLRQRAGTPLERMFTPEAMTALAQRSRLDDALWRYVVGQHLAPAAVEALREAAFAAAVARHARLMEGPALTEAKAAPPEPAPQPELQPEPEPEPEPELAPEPPPPPRRSRLAGLPWPFRARR